jgi:hypothetical protein
MNDIIIEMKRLKERKKERKKEKKRKKERKKEGSLQVPSVISEECRLLVISSYKGRERKERIAYSSRYHRQQEDGTP